MVEKKSQQKKAAAAAPAAAKKAAQPKPKKETKPQHNPMNLKKWYLVDAAGQTLGRMATRIANILRGKNKPTFVPYADEGDFIVCINAEKVQLTGKKWDEKLYRRHSGYYGGLKTATAREVLAKHPEEIVRQAVRGMLPKNRLGRKMINKLKIFVGPDHPHAAQRPEKLELREVKS